MVDLDIRDRSERTLMLAARFLRATGVLSRDSSWVSQDGNSRALWWADVGDAVRDP
jgi:hypothetical protein